MVSEYTNRTGFYLQFVTIPTPDIGPFHWVMRSEDSLPAYIYANAFGGMKNHVSRNVSCNVGVEFIRYKGYKVIEQE